MCGLMEDVLTRAQARPLFLYAVAVSLLRVALAIATVGIMRVSYSCAANEGIWSAHVLGAQGGTSRTGDETRGWDGSDWIVAGLATPFALTRLMASLLFGVTATDLPTVAGVTVVLFGVSLAAAT